MLRPLKPYPAPLSCRADRSSCACFDVGGSQRVLFCSSMSFCSKMSLRVPVEEMCLCNLFIWEFIYSIISSLALQYGVNVLLTHSSWIERVVLRGKGCVGLPRVFQLENFRCR